MDPKSLLLLLPLFSGPTNHHVYNFPRFKLQQQRPPSNFSVISYVPKISDHGKELSCRVDNPGLPNSAIEDSLKLEIHCELKKGVKRATRVRTILTETFVTRDFRKRRREEGEKESTANSWQKGTFSRRGRCVCARRIPPESNE